MGHCCVSWGTLAGERPLRLGCQVKPYGVMEGMLPFRVLPEILLGAEHSSPMVPTMGPCRGTGQLCAWVGGTQAEKQDNGTAS